MTSMSRPIGLIAAIGLIGGLAACGSEDDAPAEVTTTAEATASGGETGGEDATGETDDGKDGDAGEDDANDDGNAPGDEAMPGADDVRGMDFALTAREAIEQAKSEAGEGELIEIQLESEDGTYMYDLELQASGVQYDVVIDAITGETVKTGRDDDDESEPVVDIDSPLPLADALALAEETYPGSPIVGWELTSDDGRLYYSVDFADDTEVEIDVETKVTRLD